MLSLIYFFFLIHNALGFFEPVKSSSGKLSSKTIDAKSDIANILPVFKDRSWYHWFPVNDIPAENEVFEVTDDFCYDKCGTGLPHECRPIYLERTLLWKRASDQKTYNIVYHLDFDFIGKVL